MPPASGNINWMRAKQRSTRPNPAGKKSGKPCQHNGAGPDVARAGKAAGMISCQGGRGCRGCLAESSAWLLTTVYGAPLCDASTSARCCPSRASQSMCRRKRNHLSAVTHVSSKNNIAMPRDGRAPGGDGTRDILPEVRKGLLAPRCPDSARTNLIALFFLGHPPSS